MKYLYSIFALLWVTSLVGHPKIELIYSIPFPNGIAHSAKWLQVGNKQYLSVSGETDCGHQSTHLYEFKRKENRLEHIAATSEFQGSAHTQDWLTVRNKQFLAVAGEDTGASNEVRIYEYNSRNQQLYLTPAHASFDGGAVNAADWTIFKGQPYLAVGGQDDISRQNIRVYHFNPTTLELNRVASASFYNGVVNALDWLNQTIRGKAYLAAGGTEVNSVTQEVRIYEFDTTPSLARAHDENAQLILKASASLGQGSVQSLSWINTPFGYFLAVGGTRLNGDPIVQLYQFDPKSLELTPANNPVILDPCTLINSVLWIFRNGKYYLAVATENGEQSCIELHKLDNEIDTNLKLASKCSDRQGRVTNLAWFNQLPCSGYLAAVGNTIDIYNITDKDKPGKKDDKEENKGQVPSSTSLNAGFMTNITSSTVNFFYNLFKR